MIWLGLYLFTECKQPYIRSWVKKFVILLSIIFFFFFLLQVIYYFRKSKYNNKLRAKHKNPTDLPEKYNFYFAMWKFSMPSDETISIHIFSFRLIINFFFWTVFIFQFVQMQNSKENPTYIVVLLIQQQQKASYNILFSLAK